MAADSLVTAAGTAVAQCAMVTPPVTAPALPAGGPATGGTITDSLRSEFSRMTALLAQSQRLALQLKERLGELSSRQATLSRSQAQLRGNASMLATVSRGGAESLALVSHELRTPLNSMLILARILADNPDGNLSDAEVRSASTIHRAGTDLLRLINEFLDMARIKSGRIEARSEPVPIARLVEDAETTFRPIAEAKGVRFRAAVSSGVPAALRTDEHLVQHILRNLLANALAFTASGTVRLQVSVAEPAPELVPAVCFTVSDTGIGIAADAHGVIFEAFRGASGNAPRAHGGAGLGLSISRDMATLLGGSISVESTPGQGSTFTLRVPAADGPGAADMAGPSPVPVPPRTPVPLAPVDSGDDHGRPARWRTGPARRLRPGVAVLIADDHITSVFALAEILGRLGLRIRYADTVRGGIEQVTRHPETALVLLDASTPDSDGDQAVEAIRAVPGRAGLPVIALTAPATAAGPENPAGCRASACVPKPVDPQHLLAVACRLLERAPARAGRS